MRLLMKSSMKKMLSSEKEEKTEKESVAVQNRIQATSIDKVI